MKQNAKDRLILSFLLIGFVTLFFEVRHMHRFAVAQSEHPQAWIPIVMTGVLAFASLLAMFNHRQSQVVASFLFLLGLVTGGLGAYFHTKGDLRHFETVVLNTNGISTSEGEEEEERGRSKAPEGPPLAPLSITGLSGIGLVVAAMNRKGSKGSGS